jgi:hypothetical protein
LTNLPLGSAFRLFRLTGGQPTTRALHTPAQTNGPISQSETHNQPGINSPRGEQRTWGRAGRRRRAGSGCRRATRTGSGTGCAWEGRGGAAGVWR